MKYFYLLFLLLSLSAQAEIREAKFMHEALGNLAVGDVVVLDIDNTLLEPAQTLGSDQWFDYLIEKYKNTGLEIPKAVERALQDWQPVQLETKVKLVEGYTPTLIREIRAKGVKVLALTARGNQLSQVTLQQLRSAGIELPTYPGFNNPNIIYSEGVIFANGQNKGHVLRDFFARTQILPARLLFVDDKIKNVKNMDAEFAKDVFPNINYRYGAADERVKAFSKEIAELEWMYFSERKILISDEEAKKILEDGI